MSNKGSAYEREFCKLLSLWWSDGKRSDCFWRTGGSGGRAKVRGRRNQQTHGQHGDIAATHPSAEPLTDLLTIELKRGYSTATIADLLDRPSGSAQQTWEKWYWQARESAENAGSFSWLMVQRRDKRQPLVFFPGNLLEQLNDLGCFEHQPPPFAQFTINVRGRWNDHHKESVVVTSLQNWFDCVSPQNIRYLAQRN